MLPVVFGVGMNISIACLRKNHARKLLQKNEQGIETKIEKTSKESVCF